MTHTGTMSTATTAAAESPRPSDIVFDAFGMVFGHPFFGLVAIIGLAMAFFWVLMVLVPSLGDAVRYTPRGDGRVSENETP